MSTNQLRIIRSHSNRALAKALTRQLRLDMQGLDPFVPLSVGVDTPSTGAWLRDVVAAEHGIAMNSIYPLMGGAIEAALGAALGRADDGDSVAAAWTPRVATWHILQILADLGQDEALAALRDYLGGERGLGTRSLSLATRVAASFDRYLIHRPGLVASWLIGRDDPRNEPDIRWQAELMRRLAARVGPPEHRLWAARGWPAAAPARDVQGQGASSPLHIFAVTSLPTAILHWLWVIAHSRDVHLFVRSPIDALPGLGSDLFTDTDPTVHVRGLPATLGAMADGVTELERVLLGIEAGDRIADGRPAAFAAFETPKHCRPSEQPVIELDTGDLLSTGQSASDGGISLLGILQRSLRDGEVPPVTLADEPDDSFQVHACYGLVRQAEVVREVILGLLQDRPSLEPRDILILSPDIEAHAPLLEAAFAAGRAPDSTEPGPPRLPLRVMGRSAWRTNVHADLVVRLIRLARGRVTLTEVLDLLAIDAVRRRFGLEEGDVARCRDLLVAAGARWGIDGRHHADFGLPDDDAFSWSFVLERITAGVLLAEDAELVAWEAGDGVVAPLQGLEGGDLAWLGGLVAFIRALVRWLPEIARGGGEAGARTIAAWVALVIGAVEGTDAGDGADVTQRAGVLETFAAPGEERWHWEEVVAGLVAMADEAATTTFPMTPDAFIMALEAQFSEPARGTLGSPAVAGVSLAALTTAAGLPARVVILFGFDQDAWPSVAERPGFDVMARSPVPGDPDVRRHQRGAFVDAIMQADETLIITYAGRNPVSDEILAPSVMVLELLDALDTSLASESRRLSERITRWHPLQPFSESNFAPDAPFSHDPGLLRAAVARRHRVHADENIAHQHVHRLESDAVPTMELAQIERDLRDPARAFVRDALGVHRTSFAESARVDREPIGLGQTASGGSGQSHAIWRESLFEDPWGEAVRSAPVPPEAVEARYRALGWLPPGKAGTRALESIARFTDAQRLVYDTQFGDASRTSRDVALDLPLPASTSEIPCNPAAARVLGRIEAQRGDAMVGLTRWAPNEEALLPLWLKALVARALPIQPTGAPERSVTTRLALIGRGTPRNPARLVEHPIDPALNTFAPEVLLGDLVSIVLAARQHAIPLFRRASPAFVRALAKDGPVAGGGDRVAGLSTTPEIFWCDYLDRMHRAEPARVATAFDEAWKAFVGDGFDGGPSADRDSPNVMDLFGTLTSLDAIEDPRAALPGASRGWSFAALALRVWGPLFILSNGASSDSEDLR